MPLRSSHPYETAQQLTAFFRECHELCDADVQVEVRLTARRRQGRTFTGRDVEKMLKSIGIFQPHEPGAPDERIDDLDALGIDMTGSEFVDEASDRADDPFMEAIVVNIKEPAEWAVPIDGVWYDGPESAARALRRKAGRYRVSS